MKRYIIFTILMLLVPLVLLLTANYYYENDSIVFDNFILKLELSAFGTLFYLEKILKLILYFNVLFLLIEFVRMYQSRKIKLSSYSNQLKNKYAELFNKRGLFNLLRKIIVNLFIAFIFFPLILLTKEFNTIFSNEWADYNSLKEYIWLSLEDLGYPFFSFFFLIFILIPFQLIKDSYYKRGKGMRFIKKVSVLFLLSINCVIIIHIFINFLMFDILIQLVLYGLLSLLFATITYFFIDRYVERNYN
ncbi:hypothetical protein GCM10010984_04850 [Chishuiella changwenlii]|uniref:Uncharacterized protein n=1 Tax=Chishuiella changwenlii TaxID=1434701 RepID=A0ABQ1TBW4_9FLAO|nr:hypothetical protein [Chishuiella changwenlii]GGE90179.1 hypothetical protein GCM10010984_04850 [Chishuiella changwenlii]